MCGILGGINTEMSLSNFPLQTVTHRGPDDKGVLQYQNVQLGHTRLSILDLSANGHQPMLLDDGEIAIVFNGEIYNHLELRKQLPNYNIYHSSSDTETLLHAYNYWGIDMLGKIKGIFAMALLDKKKGKLFVVRDHFGVKPLYIYQKDRRFLFGSELKSLIKFPMVDKTIKYEALVNYLNFLWAPGEQTPFHHFKKLLPGHYMAVDLATNKIHPPKRYYDVPFNGEYSIYQEEDALAQLEEIFSKSVQDQLLSDVPIGFFLSGGLDSSAVVAMARMHNPGMPLSCFTIDTGGSDYEGFANDLPYAQKVAKHLNVDLHIVDAKPNIVDNFDQMIYHLDEPQADPAPLNVLNICKAARQQGIKVLLGGTGGDDIFSGYRNHQALYYERYFQFVPHWLGRLAKKTTNPLDSKIPFFRRLKKITSNLDKGVYDRMSGYAEWLPLPINKSLFNSDIRSIINEHQPKDYFIDLLQQIPNEKNLLNQKLYWDMKGFLVDHNLNYTDKMSMAVGVEARVPFLDINLVNFTTKLHPNLKMKGTTTKYLLKKVMEKYLPSEVIYRPKTGFGAPVRQWILNDLDEKIQDELSFGAISNRGVFDPKAVHQLITDNRAGKLDASYSIWSLLAIESWFKQFID